MVFGSLIIAILLCIGVAYFSWSNYAVYAIENIFNDMSDVKKEIFNWFGFVSNLIYPFAFLGLIYGYKERNKIIQIISIILILISIILKSLFGSVIDYNMKNYLIVESIFLFITCFSINLFLYRKGFTDMNDKFILFIILSLISFGLMIPMISNYTSYINTYTSKAFIGSAFGYILLLILTILYLRKFKNYDLNKIFMICLIGSLIYWLITILSIIQPKINIKLKNIKNKNEVLAAIFFPISFIFIFLLGIGLNLSIFLKITIIFVSIIFLGILYGLIYKSINEKTIDNEIKTILPDIGEIPKDLPIEANRLENILKNLNHFKMNISKKYDELFDKAISGKIQTYTELIDILDKMTNEALENQNIYLLYQLLQCRIKLVTDQIGYSYKFGTFDWLFQTYFKNNFQIFLYVISSIIFFGFLIYLILFNIKLPSGIPPTNNIFTLIFTLINLGLLIFSQNYFEDPAVKYYDGLPKDLKPYEENLNKNNGIQKSRISVLSIYYGLTFILSIITLIVNRINKNDTLNLITFSNLVGLIFAFNIYYGFLLPHLMIILIFLQKFYLQYPISFNNLNELIIFIIKIVFILFVFGMSLYETQYKDTTKYNIYNQQVWFIFAVILSLFIYNIILTKYSISIYEYNMILMPIMNGFLNLIGTDIFKGIQF